MKNELLGKQNAFIRKRKGIARDKWREYGYVASIVAWPLLIFFVFFAGGQIQRILLAFQQYDKATGEFSFLPFSDMFDNFKQFFVQLSTTSMMQSMALRSIGLYFMSYVTLIPHLLISFCIYKGVRYTEFFKIMLYIPNIVASVVWLIMYKIIVEYGFPQIANWFGGEMTMSLFMNNDTVFWTIYARSLWLGLGSGLVLYSGTFSGIPYELVEAGKVDGMNTWQEFWKITIPMSFPVISIGLYTGVVSIFTADIGQFTYFGTNAPASTYTFGYYFFSIVYKNLSTPTTFPYSAAVSLIFMFVAAPLSFLYKHLLEKYGPSTEEKVCKRKK